MLRPKNVDSCKELKNAQVASSKIDEGVNTSMADNTQASASLSSSEESTDEQQQQQQPTPPSTPTRTEDDEVHAPSQTNYNVAKQQTTNTAITAVNAFEKRLMEKALANKNAITNNNEEESSTSLLQQENMSTTDESSSNIHGLEVVPDDKDLPRPSSDFDDSIEKKQKKKIELIIILLVVDLVLIMMTMAKVHLCPLELHSTIV